MSRNSSHPLRRRGDLDLIKFESYENEVTKEGIFAARKSSLRGDLEGLGRKSATRNPAEALRCKIN